MQSECVIPSIASDEHSHTLGKFSICHQFGGMQNTIQNRVTHMHVRACILARRTASPSLSSPLRICEQDSLLQKHRDMENFYLEITAI